MKKATLILAASLLCSSLAAQEINKEITLDKEIVPELRAATRLNISPDVVRPAVAHNPLSLSDREIQVNIPPYMTRLDAAKTLPAVSLSPYKGYVKAGYFPAYNLGLSAGYQAVNDSLNRFNIFGQFNGLSYKRDCGDDLKRKVTDNTGLIGADYTHFFNKYQRIDLSLDLLFSATKLGYDGEMAENLPDDKNTAFGADFTGVWRSGNESGNYYAGLSAEYFSNSPKKIKTGNNIPGVAQGVYNLLFGVNYNGFSLDATAGLNNINHVNIYAVDPDRNDIYPELTEGGSKTAFIVSAIPAYTFRGETAMAKIGVHVNYHSALGKNFVIAPDIHAAIAPATNFSAYLNVTGGSDLNSAFSLYNYSHFMNPRVAYESSDIPVKAELGLVIGPFKGASIELYGGYAIANDWLMPIVYAPGLASMNSYAPVDMKGWNAGVRVKYEYSGFITARAGISFAPQSVDKGWYEWRDRAKQVIDIDLSVRPLKALCINAGWQLRSKRAQGVYVAPEVVLGDLDDLSDLHVGAEYNFTDRFSIFANVNNILNKKSLLLSDVPAQGLTGLVGVNFLF